IQKWFRRIDLRIAAINLPRPKPQNILAPTNLPQLPIFSREIIRHNLPRQNPLELSKRPPHHIQTSLAKFPSRLKPQPQSKRLQRKFILLPNPIQHPEQLRNAQRFLLPALPPKKFLRPRPKVPRTLFM